MYVLFFFFRFGSFTPSQFIHVTPDPQVWFTVWVFSLPLGHHAQARVMDVTVPAGLGPGDTVEFPDAEGNTMTVVIPDGCAEGDVFRVDEMGLVVEHHGSSSIMDNFVQWFEREEIGDKVDQFIRDHASVLGAHRRHDTGAEHSHELWPIYQEYAAQFDTLLQQFLNENGCSSEEFLAASKNAEGMEEIYVQLFLAHAEYEMFIELLSHEAVVQASAHE